MTGNCGSEASLQIPPAGKQIIGKRIHRPLSIAAGVWIAASSLYPNIWTTIIVEGHGTTDQQRWKEAIKAASEANPGSRLVLKGNLSRSHWVDSGDPPWLQEFDGSLWKGTISEGLNVLLNNYNVRQGPTAEIVIFHGSPIRVMFRAHHAVMDGRGVLTWAEDVFRVLNGLPPLGSNHLIVENDLLHLPDKIIHQPPAYNFISPAGKPSGYDPERIWRRLSVQGHHSKLLPRLMILTARAARRKGKGRVRFAIPVDLRPRCPGLRSTGNLTNAIYIEVEPESTVDQIDQKIQRRLRGRDDGKLNLEDKLIPYVPIRMLSWILAGNERQQFKTGRYRCSGFISNLGRVDLNRFSGDGFTPTGLFLIPVSIPSLPFFLAISGYRDVTEYILEMPKSFAGQGRLEEILNYIVAGLDHVE